MAVTLTSQADVAATREALIVETWGTTTLPQTLPTVTTIANPFGSRLPNVGTVYNYHTAMSNGQVNDSDLYLNSHSNGRVVIFNMGHSSTTFWPSMGPPPLPMLNALLANGFSVFAMNMPVGDHPALFATYGGAAMQYFLEPAVQAMNYWEDHGMFSQFGFVGISGGGWTGAVLQALDTRVKTAILVAGSLPGTQFCCQSFPIKQLPNQGDQSFASEQSWTPFYSIVGYVDLYLMGANGDGRGQLQILNINDTCCFGPMQWTSIYVAANDGRDWFQQVRYYESLIQHAPIPSNFSVVEDFTAGSHELSDPFTVELTLSTLLFSG